MQTKTCTKCGETKAIPDFGKHKGRKDGLADWCRSCKREYDAGYRERNPNKNKDDYAKRKSLNPDYWADWYAENRDKALARTKAWQEENKETVKAKNAAWYAENGLSYHAAWRQKHRESMRQRARESYKQKKDDPRWRVENSIKVGMHKSLGDTKAGRHWESIAGYTVADLMAHLETQFQPGMTWENYGRGGWHIDHIIPRSAFNYETPDDIDFKRCWALDNLQPLWEFENISKGAKLDKPFQPSLALAIPNDNNLAAATQPQAA